MTLDERAARTNLLTSRECAKLIGALVGGFMRGVKDVNEVRSPLVMTAVLAGCGTISPGPSGSVTAHFQTEAGQVDLEVVPPSVLDRTLACAFGALHGGLLELASEEVVREAWQWWALSDKAWRAFGTG